MEFIKAAGGIVHRDGEQGTEIVLVHRTKYDDWSLPKGKLEPGERWEDAAIREVEEETQAQVVPGAFAGVSLYQHEQTPKVVLYWLMSFLGAEDFRPNPEIDRILWLPVADAIARLDHVDEKALVRQSGLTRTHFP